VRPPAGFVSGFLGGLAGVGKAPMTVWMGWTGHPAGGGTRADAHYNQPSFFFLFSFYFLLFLSFILL
jgi:hypothetical protein